MRNPNVIRQVRETIYALKKEFGEPVSVYKLSSASTDYETGVKTATRTSVDVRLCPILPAGVMRKFAQSAAYLKTSAPFTTPGGQGWDQGTRGFIFDARDLPVGYVFEIEDWVVYDSRRYDPKEVIAIEGLGWMVTATEVRGALPEQIINLNVVDTFGVEQTPGIDPDNLWRRAIEDDLGLTDEESEVLEP